MTHHDQTGATAAVASRANGVAQLDLHRLVVFYTLVNEGTMSRASEMLYISQPAISAHIKSLESGLGVSLFNRVGRRSVVSSAGRVLYEKSERLLEAADELKTAMEDLRGTSIGRLVLGASMVWQYRLPAVLGIFQHRYPKVELNAQMANSDRIERLVQDRSVDIGLIARAPVATDPVSKRLASDEVLFVMSPDHSLATAGAVDPGDLAVEPLIVRESGSAVRQATENLLRRAGVRSSFSMELGSQEAIQQVAALGRGVGLVSRRGAAPMLRSRALVTPGDDRVRAPLVLYLVYHRRKKLTAVQKAFVEMLEVEGELDGHGKPSNPRRLPEAGALRQTPAPLT